ncbi:class II glutamine amidotransferase [uncultured Jatrophihabitans sp.]|uniref:class II glutamine amidotransferase n=1 Tax=uncultured Jatrophihabitans sp. TaxID=1610747 RepID=UPI0035CC1D5E
MCRLFGLHAGAAAVSATFWLLDAPDSLAAQSHRNPDGAGIGVFDPAGRPHVDKQPIAAWDDTEFASAARELRGTTFVAHVRHASTGAHTQANTHPFEQDGRLFAHNGVVEGLDLLDARLAELGADGLVQGETDSERVFALITAEIARNGGDIRAGLTEAIGWIADQLPVYSVNFILATASDLWALRYPATNELWLLERSAGGDARHRAATAQTLDVRTDRIRARCEQFAEQPSVILASEPMDGDAGWRLLTSGELVHVAVDLTVETSTPFPAAPRRQLGLGDLAPSAATSQQARP